MCLRRTFWEGVWILLWGCVSGVNDECLKQSVVVLFGGLGLAYDDPLPQRLAPGTAHGCLALKTAAACKVCPSSRIGQSNGK